MFSSRCEYHMFYVLYPFVTYLLTLIFIAPYLSVLYGCETSILARTEKHTAMVSQKSVEENTGYKRESKRKMERHA
jgi:hypothetical protein